MPTCLIPFSRNHIPRNAMEFISDEYASWDVNLFHERAYLNRLPLIKSEMERSAAIPWKWGNLIVIKTTLTWWQRSASELLKKSVYVLWVVILHMGSWYRYWKYLFKSFVLITYRSYVWLIVITGVYRQRCSLLMKLSFNIKTTCSVELFTCLWQSFYMPVAKDSFSYQNTRHIHINWTHPVQVLFPISTWSFYPAASEHVIRHRNLPTLFQSKGIPIVPVPIQATKPFRAQKLLILYFVWERKHMPIFDMIPGSYRFCLLRHPSNIHAGRKVNRMA